MPPRIAICYWGMTRSTRMVYQTHQKHIFDVLRSHGAEFDVYLHTWKTELNIVWTEACPIEHDYTEHKYLNPIQYCIDDQDDFLSNIRLEDYYYAHEKHSEWWPDLIRNHICALESQRRCVNMMIASNRPYDYVMFLRPDALFMCDLPYREIFDVFSQFGISGAPKVLPPIVIPDDKKYHGKNDQFAVVPFSHVLPYSHRLQYMADYRQIHGVITSEKYVGYVIDQYYCVHYITFPFNLIRSDGKSNMS